MEMPEFPKEFVRKHCSKVLEARSWRRNFKLPPDPEDDEAHAECAFNSAGMGLKCENCNLYIHPSNQKTPNPLDRPCDFFYADIKQYYDDMEKYENYMNTDEYKEKMQKQKDDADAQKNLGAYI